MKHRPMLVGGLALLILGAVAAWQPAAGTPGRDRAWVDRRVQALRVRLEESPMGVVAWAGSLPAALERANRERRLIYLVADRGDFFTGRA